MLKLGVKQTLTIVKVVEFGVYLAVDAEHKEERVLLPAKQVPKEARLGDAVEVFLYKDSKDRLIATTNTPRMALHECGRCRVSAVTKIGAFLDWGLEKELLLPYREQTYPVKEGEEVLAALYIDKSSRLCATMKVYPYLSKESPYVKDDAVEGLVYEVSNQFGAFVAVDYKFSALIPQKELYAKVAPGDWVSARVSGVKEDGKLDLSLRQKAYLQMDEDAKLVKAEIEKRGGRLPFTDKASPELIRDEMGMSKNEFKRAIGRLYKQKLIEITPDSIILK